jgi:glutaconate CoA-transferase subunit B
MSAASRDEIPTVVAARLLHDGDVCFVGIDFRARLQSGPPTHAPDIVLIYESGTIGARPRYRCRSVMANSQTAACVVPCRKFSATICKQVA